MESFAKRLRTNQTSWELKLWKKLRAGRSYSLKFKRQVIISDYIVDFYCHEHKLIIEILGYPHKKSEQKTKDQKRTIFLKDCGYTILTFWNGEIDQDLDKVLVKIKNSIGL